MRRLDFKTPCIRFEYPRRRERERESGYGCRVVLTYVCTERSYVPGVHLYYWPREPVRVRGSMNLRARYVRIPYVLMVFRSKSRFCGIATAQNPAVISREERENVFEIDREIDNMSQVSTKKHGRNSSIYEMYLRVSVSHG